MGKIQTLERLRVQLDERSPLRVLQRGYAICTDAAGNVVSAADQVAVGAEVKVQLARGRLGAEVRSRREFQSLNSPRFSFKVFSALRVLCGERFSEFNTENTEGTEKRMRAAAHFRSVQFPVGSERGWLYRPKISLRRRHELTLTLPYRQIFLSSSTVELSASIGGFVANPSLALNAWQHDDGFTLSNC